ncbi:MAG TPA: hypothetical protein O0X70_07935 [Methanocorpusculum sp.]|nr:hypothetical protein [Methanocorpusculum sp.]
MAEAFNTSIVLKGKEAEDFLETMVYNTPEDMLISDTEFAELEEIAGKLGFNGKLR